MIKLRSLTFAENNILKNVEKHIFFKNYKERFERSLHLWGEQISTSVVFSRQLNEHLSKFIIERIWFFEQEEGLWSL